MSNLVFLLFLLVCFHDITNRADCVMQATTSNNPRAINFIKRSCRATLYPVLCFHSLSTYANQIQQNERQLAETALAVSLAKAQHTTMSVYRMTKMGGVKPRECQAVRDCVDNMADSVDQLSRSMKEFDHMGGVGGQHFMWLLSNVQTWVSAALTDENTCIDGFAGRSMQGNVKAAINSRIVNVVQLTSNALALVNRFADMHNANSP